MKISVVICSRGRPLGLTGVVMALWRLRSAQHEITFHIGCDDDDAETVVAAGLLQEEVRAFVWPGPRPVARGEVENRTLAQTKDADVVTMLTDRTFCITPGWDVAIAQAATEQPKRVLWWSCPEDLVCVMPIIPRAWLEACDWKWSPEIFPFWFDDTWHQQIDLMLYGIPSLKVLTSYSGVRAETTRARDFEFWIGVFRATFPMRLAQARMMAERLGVEFISRDDVSQYFQNHHTALMSGLKILEEKFGDSREPGPQYLAAKKRAETMLKEMARERPEVEVAE